MTEGINLSLDCELAILTIDRPSARNALDAQSIADFSAAVAQVEADDTITMSNMMTSVANVTWGLNIVKLVLNLDT